MSSSPPSVSGECKRLLLFTCDMTMNDTGGKKKPTNLVLIVSSFHLFVLRHFVFNAIVISLWNPYIFSNLITIQTFRIVVFFYSIIT